MAFRFAAIDQQMTPQQQNIFDPSSSQNAMQGDTQGSAPALSGGGSAMSSGGGGGPSGAGGGSSQAQTQGGSSGGAPSSSQVSAFKSNSARARAPSGAVEGIKGSLAAAEQKLQSDANAYTQKAQDTAEGYRTVDKTKVDQAAGGDEKALSDVGNRLQGEAASYSGFEGLGADTPTAADRLANPSGLYGGTKGYTSGLGRYDAALLRSNRDFRGIQSQLNAEQERIKQESDKKAKELSAQARENIKKGWEEGKAGIRDYLGTLSTDTLARAKELERAEDEKRAKMTPDQFNEERYQKILKAMGEDFKVAPDSVEARALKNLGSSRTVDLGRFYDFDRDTDYQEFLSDEEAKRFNRIQGLLGSDELVTPVSAGPGDPYSFDEAAAYRAIMGDIVGQQQALDRANALEEEKKALAIKEAAEAEARAKAQAEAERIARERQRAAEKREQRPKRQKGKYEGAPQYEN
jgi:hypothetical protein